MDRGPPPWQLTLARIEGALPFLRAEVADGLARASLRRLLSADKVDVIASHR
jgi:hypothetical protein